MHLLTLFAVNIVVLIANKRSVGDYNSDSMRADYLDFASKGELHGNATEVLFTQVIVNGAQNRKLADRIGVKPGDEFKFPELFLYKANSNEPIPYPRRSSWNIAQFTRWLSKHTNFYYGIEGTIEKYDLLAERFMFADKSEHEKIIKEAEAMASTLEPHERDNAEIYVKTMSKIAEKGYDFIFTEIDRLSKLLTTDISKSKKSDFVKRINIAYQFDRLDSPTGEENPEL